MDWKIFFTIFISVFIAEIGDKTQVATMLFSADGSNSRWLVFFASASALVFAAGIGVLFGSQLEKFLSPDKLKLIAGIGFILIGVWNIFS